MSHEVVCGEAREPRDWRKLRLIVLENSRNVTEETPVSGREHGIIRASGGSRDQVVFISKCKAAAALENHSQSPLSGLPLEGPKHCSLILSGPTHLIPAKH